MHGHVQPVALGVACSKVGIGRGMGFRDSNQDLLGFVHMAPGAGTRADPRHRGDAAPRRRRLPPVPAADEARQRRRRDRASTTIPAWLVLAVDGLRPGDRRPVGSSTSRSRSTTCPAPSEPLCRSSAAGDRLHARAARAARVAADRPCRLERLPQPQRVLRDARRVVPDGREPRRAAPPSRSSSPGCSCSPRATWREIAERCGDDAGGRAGSRGRDTMVAAVDAHGWDGALVPPRVRLLRRARSARRRTTRARSSSSPRGSASWRASAWTTDARGARSTAWTSGSRRRTAIVLQQPAFSRVPAWTRRDLVVPARLQGERRRSSATRTRG